MIKPFLVTDTDIEAFVLILLYHRFNFKEDISAKELSSMLELSDDKINSTLESLDKKDYIFKKAIEISTKGLSSIKKFLEQQQICYIKLISIKPLPKNGLDGDQFLFTFIIVNQNEEKIEKKITVGISGSLSTSWYYDTKFKEYNLETLLLPLVQKSITESIFSGKLAELNKLVYDTINSSNTYPYEIAILNNDDHLVYEYPLQG